jgi:hypothetical protein
MQEMSTEKIPIDKVKYTKCTFKEAEFTIEKHNWKFYAKDSTGNEVGKADCVVGEIRKIDVEKTARQCGLANIFTTLCLIDLDMNGLVGNVADKDLADINEALDALEGYKTEKDWATKNCKSLWWLWFRSDPIAGGFAYFNAAIATGFTNMMIQEDKSKQFFGPVKTKKWKKKFSPDTGVIDNKPPIESFNGNWFLCKPK